MTLTETGLSRLGELQRGLHQAEEGLLEPLEHEERTVLRELLQRLAMTMSPANPCQMIQQLEAETAPDVPAKRRRR